MRLKWMYVTDADYWDIQDGEFVSQDPIGWTMPRFRAYRGLDHAEV